MDVRDYEKMTDDICFLGNNAMLKFNVLLSSKDKSGYRRHFHSEFVYNTEKYVDNSSGVSIKRNFSSYLTIDFFKVEGVKPFVKIDARDIILLRLHLNKCMYWLTNENGTAFGETKDGQVKLFDVEGNTSKLRIGQLTFEFSPCFAEEFDIKDVGVRLVIKEYDLEIRMSMRSFLGFKYHIDTINLFLSAQTAVNYLGRPKEVNRIHMNTNDKSTDSIMGTALKARVPKAEQQSLTMNDLLG